MRILLASLVLALTVLRCASTPVATPPIDDDTRNTIENLRSAVAEDPGDGAQIYTLAQYLDRTGDVDESLKWLAELERIGWTHGVNDHDFVHARSQRAYAQVASRLNSADPRVARGRHAFVVRERDLIPEGIAFDPATGDFYIGSIHRRKIVRVSPDGTASDFITEGRDGLLGALGMKIDPERRLLWVASTAAAEMAGYTDANEGQSALMAFRLDDGSLATRCNIGLPDQPSLLNDLVLLADGSVLVTDTARGSVMRAVAGSTALEIFLPAGTFLFPNGIALSDDGRTLFVADFRGIARVSMADRSIEPVALPVPHETVSGIDGLTFYRGSLIAIQNGVGRPRVIRAVLNDEFSAIDKLEILESGNPAFDEPTTGVIARGSFYYMLNPQLRAFDEQHRIWPDDRLRDIIVDQLPLE